MSEDDTGSKHEHTGRTAMIDTGYYQVQVWGDPDDTLSDVTEAVEDAADRAKADVKELVKADPSNGDHYA